MSDPREKRVELILQQLEELPTLPSVAMQVLATTSRDDSTFADVVQLISSDPSLSARILQLVRRADVGGGNVSSVQQAVTLLGFDAVRSAVLSVSVFQTFSGSSSGGAFKREEFWQHALAVACCAELLAEKLPKGGVSSSEAFVCGLLHDLGKVALDTILPKSFSRVVEGVDLLRGDIADLERTIIGLDHLVVGKRLAERWQLPTNVRDVIWLHGQPPEALPSTIKDARLINLVSLADLLVRESHLGYSGNYTFAARSTWSDTLGLSAEAMETVLKQLVIHIQPRATALGLGEANTVDLYHQAISQANRELGRMNSRLASSGKRLAGRAKFFDVLSAFQGELRPDADAQSVLRAMGRAAAELLSAPVIAAFSLPPGATSAESVMVGDLDKVVQTSLVECTVRPSPATVGDGPVMSAGDELDWLLCAVSPRLSERARFWICLSAENQTIGGVVWGAAPGEAHRLEGQVQELTALANAWSLALRAAQIREESRNLTEQLADSLRRLHSAQNEISRNKTIITVGEMAAGAAHEMNNPLAVISGRSQLLASQLTDPRHKHAANLIYEQSHRLSEIITELMDFAKPLPATRQIVDLADLVGRALHDAKMLDESADRNIEVTLTDVPPVMVDETQVAAALAELIGNAVQATDPGVGRIEIHAAHEASSSQVALTITDNGHGMDEGTLKRAFDPFFSAKPAGRRRGMGLPKALRWVESSGGSIRLESRPNQGTRSLVLLPVAEPTAQQQRADVEKLSRSENRKAAQ
jgi:putative nucleotidyltransferase with HDIG domain